MINFKNTSYILSILMIILAILSFTFNDLSVSDSKFANPSVFTLLGMITVAWILLQSTLFKQQRCLIKPKKASENSNLYLINMRYVKFSERNIDLIRDFLRSIRGIFGIMTACMAAMNIPLGVMIVGSTTLSLINIEAILEAYLNRKKNSRSNGMTRGVHALISTSIISSMLSITLGVANNISVISSHYSSYRDFATILLEAFISLSILSGFFSVLAYTSNLGERNDDQSPPPSSLIRNLIFYSTTFRGFLGTIATVGVFFGREFSEPLLRAIGTTVLTLNFLESLAESYVRTSLNEESQEPRLPTYRNEGSDIGENTPLINNHDFKLDNSLEHRSAMMEKCSSPIKSVFVVGDGSIGKALTAELIKSNKYSQNKIHVILITREKQPEKYRNGFSATVNNNTVLHRQDDYFCVLSIYDVLNLKNVSENPIVFIATKSYHINNVLECIEIVAKKNPTIITLQNGLYSYHQAKKKFFNDENIKVLHGVVHVASTNKPDGSVEYHGGKIEIERNPEVEKVSKNMIHDPFSIEIIPTDEIEIKAKTKLALNCVINPLTAIYNQPMGKILVENEKVKKLAFDIAEEALNILEIPKKLPEVKILIKKYCKTYPDHISSMHSDFIKSSEKTEIDELNGEICMLAKKRGMKSNLNTILCNIITSMFNHYSKTDEYVKFNSFHKECGCEYINRLHEEMSKVSASDNNNNNNNEEERNNEYKKIYKKK